MRYLTLILTPLPLPAVAGQLPKSCCSLLATFVFDMDDDLQLLQDLRDITDIRRKYKKNEKTDYPAIDPMAMYGDEAFKNRYRMTKDSVHELLGLIENDMPKAKCMGRRPIPNMMKLPITLRFLAEGCFQKTAGDCHGHCQATVSKVIGEVCPLIAKLASRFIVFPTGQAAAAVATGMYEMVSKRWPGSKAMPKVYGCVDGTHINIDGHGMGRLTGVLACGHKRRCGHLSGSGAGNGQQQEATDGTGDLVTGCGHQAIVVGGGGGGGGYGLMAGQRTGDTSCSSDGGFGQSHK